MDIMEAVLARRSVRSFKPGEVPMETLTEMVEAARVGPSAANRQPLEYILVTNPTLRQEVFKCLKWAAYIAPRGNPQPGKEPTAYVVICRRKELELEGMSIYDVGAAAATIFLVGVANGVQGCWIKSINYPKISNVLGVPPGIEVDSVLALGYPGEDPQRVDLSPQDEGLEAIKYWRDEKERHFVPKRSLERILHAQKHGGK